MFCIDDLVADTDRIRRVASRDCPWHGKFCPGRVPPRVFDELIEAMISVRESEDERDSDPR